MKWDSYTVVLDLPYQITIVQHRIGQVSEIIQLISYQIFYFIDTRMLSNKTSR